VVVTGESMQRYMGTDRITDRQKVRAQTDGQIDITLTDGQTER